jgi:hypothetical protein
MRILLEIVMLEKQIERERAPWAWVAARDARQRSLAAQTHYTPEQQARAERMRLVLELVYSNRAIYVSYRQKFIAVKVENPLVINRQLLRTLEKDWEDLDYQKVVTNQGITYRIPRI